MECLDCNLCHDFLDLNDYKWCIRVLSCLIAPRAPLRAVPLPENVCSANAAASVCITRWPRTPRPVYSRPGSGTTRSSAQPIRITDEKDGAASCATTKRPERRVFAA